MSREVERKFLVSHIPALITHGLRPKQIRQGYITKDPSGQQVRIRSKGNYYYLTVRGKEILERDEVEMHFLLSSLKICGHLREGEEFRKNVMRFPTRDTA